MNRMGRRHRPLPWGAILVAFYLAACFGLAAEAVLQPETHKLNGDKQ